MIKPKVYHATLTANTPYTFTFDVDGSKFYVKNFTEGNLTLSYGDEIDSNSYQLIPRRFAQLVCSSLTATPEVETNKITVSATSSGIVEIQILEY